jgi:plasmid maintenance system antidote protein VapI
MTITIPADKVLSLLGEHGEHWTQGTWGNDQQMCLHGAIRRCQPQPGDAFIVEQVANRLGWGTGWNDADDTTFDDIKARIVAGLEITDTDLADTFGPQWESIVALVRRAATLTADEAQKLSATWGAWAASSAWSATYDAARAASAAWSAARIAWAASAAWSAAYDAAWALSLRNLIGQHGFTQEHYNTLTRPWATVIGKVHPDDKERA